MVAKANFKLRRWSCFFLPLPPDQTWLCSNAEGILPSGVIGLLKTTSRTESSQTSARKKKAWRSELSVQPINEEKNHGRYRRFSVDVTVITPTFTFQCVTNNGETKYLDFWASERM